MSRWTHSICWPCWKERSGTREPATVRPRPLETCCFCGTRHVSGIYIRREPAGLLCRGEHAEAPAPAEGK